jgi:predicted enzyme related to lactoylglutathione lyase
MLTFGSVVIGVEELPRASAFWQAALDYRTREDPEDTWAVLVPRDGASGPQIALMLSPSDTRNQPRIHVDLYADDPDAEVERLTALGASRQDVDGAVHVLEDTEGNRFCVIGVG